MNFQRNNEFRKLFLSIEKLLIDFRLNQLDSEDYKFECTPQLGTPIAFNGCSVSETNTEAIIKKLVDEKTEEVEKTVVLLQEAIKKLGEVRENLDQKIVEKIQEVLSGDLKLVVEDKNFNETLKKALAKETLKPVSSEEQEPAKEIKPEVPQEKPKVSRGKISVGGTKFKVFEELHLNTVSKNTDGNTVEYNKNKAAEQAETISAVLK